MLFDIREVNGAECSACLNSLHLATFPADEMADFTKGRWWIASDLYGRPVAFAGGQVLDHIPGYAYLSRAGVLPEARGQRLQSRLIQARSRGFKRRGTKTLVTTTFHNPTSANNLIRSGFLMYSPEVPWGAEGTCYWIKQL